MSLEISIKKDYGSFALDMEYKTKGRRIGILGASGSGKSLTLKSIAGIETPDIGYIRVDGEVLFDSEGKINLTPRKRGVGYLFQGLALFPYMTAGENIAIAAKGKKADREEKAEKLIKDFELEKIVDEYPSKLSGGEKQRVALARILASEPKALLLDEPFSALDEYIKEEMQNRLSALLEAFAGTVVMVSHNRDEIFRNCDELVVIDCGRVVCAGRTEDIYKNPPDKTTARLTGCKNIADAVPKGENVIYIKAWDISVELTEGSANNISGAAIRAHDFTAEYSENAVAFDVSRYEIKRELFEYSVYFYTSEGAEEPLCWKVSSAIWAANRCEMPKKLYLKREKFIFFNNNEKN